MRKQSIKERLSEYDIHISYWSQRLRDNSLSTAQRRMFTRTVDDLTRDKELLLKKLEIYGEYQ